MNNWKQIFRQLKEAGVNSMFQELNRKLVLGISTGDATPKSPDTWDDIESQIISHMKNIKHVKEDDIDCDREIKFIKPVIENCISYRHHNIDIPSYGLMLDYFIVKGEPSDTPAKTMMSTVMDHDNGNFVVYSIMIIFEDHDVVTDDTLSKIVKHELTHVLLETMEYPLGISIYNNPTTDKELFDDENELASFQEFLCDYIQWDSTVSPNEHPVAKFREAMKKYLTWIASDLYEPFIQAVEEYYNEEKETKECEK